MKLDDRELTTPSEIVEGFAAYFSKAYDKCDGNCDGKIRVCPNNCDGFIKICENNFESTNVLHKFVISEDLIMKFARRLKPNLTMGNDNVPAFVVRDCISCFVSPLLH